MNELQAMTKSVDEKAMTLEVVISTETVDRDGDKIFSKGINTDEFMKNPVVLWAHKLDMPPIGKVLDVTKTESGATAVVEFAKTKVASELFELYRGGFLNAWSIGFMPKEYERSSEKGRRYDIFELEMYELSAVPVPANPEALSKGLNKIKSDEILNMFDYEKEEDDMHRLRTLQKALHEFGFSRSMSKKVASELAKRDDEENEPEKKKFESKYASVIEKYLSA